MSIFSLQRLFLQPQMRNQPVNQWRPTSQNQNQNQKWILLLKRFVYCQHYGFYIRPKFGKFVTNKIEFYSLTWEVSGKHSDWLISLFFHAFVST